MHDVPRHRLLNNWRRALFAAFVGGLALVGLGVTFAGPATVWGDNWSAIGIIVVAAEIVLLLAGLAWLVLLVTSQRGASKSERARSGEAAAADLPVTPEPEPRDDRSSAQGR